MPSFDSEWLVPLGTTSRTLEELLEEDETLVIGSDGEIRLQTDGELDPVALGDQLDVTLDGLSLDAEIGPVELEPTAPIDFDYRLGDLYPAAETLDGASAPVPGFTFDLASEGRDLPGFSTATLEAGELRLSVHNGLPVDVGGPAPPERIGVELLDARDRSSLGTVLFPEAVPPGGSDQRSLDLQGLTLPDSVAVRLVGGSGGSHGAPVTIDADAVLAVRVETVGLRVSSARAPVGAQSFADTTAVELGDSIRVQSADIASGALELQLRNDLPLDLDLVLSVDRILDPSGRSLALDIPLAAGSTRDLTHDLAAHRLDFGAQLGSELEVRLEAVTPGSGGADVLVDATDVVRMQLAPLSLRFARVTGVVDPLEVELASSSTTIDLPDELDDLELARAELVIGIRSSLGMGARIDLRLEGRAEAGTMVPLDVEVDLPAADPGQSLVHNVVLDESNSELLTFLNNLPTSIEIDGRATVGDGVSLGTVAVDDSISARWSIRAPMTVALLDQVVELDVASVDLEEDLREEIDLRVRELDLRAEVLSTLPVGARAWIGLDSDSTAVRSKPRLEVGPIEIPAAGALRADGTRPRAEAQSQIRVDESDVEAVTRSSLYQAVRIEVPGTDGRFVTLRADDRIELRGFLRARVRVGEVDR